MTLEQIRLLARATAALAAFVVSCNRYHYRDDEAFPAARTLGASTASPGSDPSRPVARNPGDMKEVSVAISRAPAGATPPPPELRPPATSMPAPAPAQGPVPAQTAPAPDAPVTTTPITTTPITTTPIESSPSPTAPPPDAAPPPGAFSPPPPPPNP